MNSFLKCISNETRLKIILCLHRYKEKTVTELLDSCNLSQSALSQHLLILKKSGIVVSKKSGKNNIYSLQNNHIATIAKTLLIESKK